MKQLAVLAASPVIHINNLDTVNQIKN